ncbi:MAG: type I-E CRISPR-associated protein Cas6/Cse3/CasE [Deltaproteobacteria bacterium]|nr:type I-E CRISPR-associated protein Cas6/Cse3/CasE [Deltaproteobacteria bacterium]
MLLHRIHLDSRCREARRDLSDPYQLHSTLCRAFSVPETKCPQGEFLWRLEPEADPTACPRVLVQSRTVPDWERIGAQGWLASADPSIDLKDRLKLDSLTAGKRFRFRLRANPCVTHDGKRLGLLRAEEQEAWLERKGKRHGFSLPRLAAFDLSESSEERIDVRISQEQMLRGNQHSGKGIRIFSVLYDGVLTVTDPDLFRDALQAGVGHGKVMGLGLLSVVPTA